MARHFPLHLVPPMAVGGTVLVAARREAWRGWMSADAGERVVMLSMVSITAGLVSLITLGLVVTE